MNISEIAKQAFSKDGIRKATHVVNKHTPEILTGVGVASVVASAIIVGKTSTQLQEPLAEHRRVDELIKKLQAEQLSGERQDYSKKKQVIDRGINVRNTAFKLVKLYALPAGLMIGGLGCILWSHKILKARNAAAMAAAVMLSDQLERYRENVRDILGVEDEENLYNGHTVKINKTGEIKVSKASDEKKDIRPTFLFDDVNAPRTWEAGTGLNYLVVSQTQNMLNHRLNVNGFVFLNDALDMLGMARVPEGQLLGWRRGSTIDFGLGETDRPGVLDFVNGYEKNVWLKFNVDGIIWDQI